MLEQQTRELRGLAIANEIGRRNNPDVSIQRLNKLTYRVKSQSSADKWYTVGKQYGNNLGEWHEGYWVCDRPDYFNRLSKLVGGKRKHVHTVIFSKLLRKKVYQDIILQTPVNQSIINEANKIGKIVCQRCNSHNYVKWGVRHN